MADYWLVEKQLVHKLFKVLVPRFENYNVAYTKMFRVPKPTPGNLLTFGEGLIQCKLDVFFRFSL